MPTALIRAWSRSTNQLRQPNRHGARGRPVTSRLGCAHPLLPPQLLPRSNQLALPSTAQLVTTWAAPNNKRDVFTCLFIYRSNPTLSDEFRKHPTHMRRRKTKTARTRAETIMLMIPAKVIWAHTSASWSARQTIPMTSKTMAPKLTSTINTFQQSRVLEDEW
jgi:hypothetical protein